MRDRQYPEYTITFLGLSIAHPSYFLVFRAFSQEQAGETAPANGSGKMLRQDFTFPPARGNRQNLQIMVCFTKIYGLPYTAFAGSIHVKTGDAYA